MNAISLSHCLLYVEDPYVCDDLGEPKGQCAHCGAKWFEHDLLALPESEKESARAIQRVRGVIDHKA